MSGIPRETVALIVVLGLVLGTFPFWGIPTLLCLAAALAFRVNLPALQVVNNLVSPIQLALMIPLARAGSRIMGAPFSWSLRTAAPQAITGWLFICVPVGLAAYFPLAYALRQRRLH